MNNIKMIFFLTVSALAGAVIALMLFFCFVGPRPQSAPPADVGKGSTLPGSALVPEPVVVPPGSASGLQREFAAAINNSMPAVVLITAQKRIGVVSPYSNLFDYRRRKIDYLDVPSGQGSGFFTREDGYILTNFHVVRDQDSFWITTHDGREFPAQVVGIDPPTDLALLKIDSKEKFPVLRFADAEKVQIGHWAIAIGAPFSLSRTVTVGIVSNKKRSGVGVNLYESYVQTDASINPGNSGGPLLNIQGEVIGVNDFILSPSGGNIGLSFAISSDIAEQVSQELIRNGRVERPWLGVILQEIDRKERRKVGLEYGVLIAQLYRNSPAAEALRPGDVVLKANNIPIHTPHDLQGVVFAAAPDSTIKMQIWRSGRKMDVEVKVRKSPRSWFNRNWSSQSGALPVRQL